MRAGLALYRKELRTLWPSGLVWTLMLSGDLLYRPFTERLDEAGWPQIASYIQPGEGSVGGWIMLLLTGALAYSAFPREYDERTIHYLYALPIRRGSIFAAKVLAAMTLITCALALLVVTDGVQGAWSDSSFLGGQWRLELALAHFALQLGFCAIVYCHALLASVLRLFGVLPYALILVVAGIVEDVYAPAAWIDPTELLVARYEGQALVVAWGPWLAHAAVALVALAASAALWLGPAERIGKGFDRARASLLGRLGLGCLGAAVLASLVVLLAVVAGLDPGDPTDEEPDPTDAPSIATVERVTDRYTLQIPESHLAQAASLVADADAIHRRVQEELGADPGPRLVADLTEVSGEHLGIASWTHIRVGLVHERDPVQLRRTFAHETAHAFQHRLSDRRQSEEARATRFFAEGSAEHIAYRVVPGDAAHRQARLVAAAMWERHGLGTDDLFDGERLTARYETTLVYTLGERWSAALSATCGDGAIGDALRAMGRAETSRHLEGRAFWRETLGAFGCDVEAVDAAFAELMTQDAEELRADLDRLPRIGGGVTGAQGGAVELVALLDRDPDPSWRFLARVRADPGASDTEVVNVRGRRDPSAPRRVTFRVPRALLPASRFQLAFALLTEPRGWPYAEPWQWASAP